MSEMRDAAMQTLATVGMIVWIGIGATALVGVFNLMGGIKFVSAMITGISDEPVIVLLFMMALLFILGMFLDWVGIALLTMPIFVPIIKALGAQAFGLDSPEDLVLWFGVLYLVNMQMSFLSPPFGPAAFYLKSVAPPDISLTDIFRGFLPFIAIQLVALSLLLIWPPLVSVFL